ncbi:MAG TPA: cytochrome P460 family protein [Pirellulales bacterium]|nr:cytochrome P460 family protein [Pirellulales bacterium]
MMVGSLRWAPGMCMAPPMTMSKAPPETPHAKKLYHLLVKDPDAYADAAQQSQPVGQVIVKQSFKAEEVKNSTDENRADAVRGRDGKLYMPGEAADLFVMFKVDSGRSGTDDGWVYGTLAPGEERATSAGRVASCMECHQNAKPDRVFGVKGLKSSGE